MSDYIYQELEQELPAMQGITAELLKGGLRRVQFLELAHAVLIGEQNFIAPDTANDESAA